METVWIFGILGAFVLGAYIRQPFALIKRAEVPPPPAAPIEESSETDKKKREDDRIQQLNNMLRFTGKEQDGED